MHSNLSHATIYLAAANSVGWTVTLIIAFTLCLILTVKLLKVLSQVDLLHRRLSSIQRKSNAVTDFLHSQSQALHEPADSILGKILEAAIKSTEATGGALFLLPPGADALKAKELRGFFPPLIPPSREAGGKVASKLTFWHDMIQTQEIPIHVGIFEELFESNRGICIDQAEMDSRLFQADDPNLRVRNLLAVPLHYNQAPLGAVVLVNKIDQLGKPLPFSDEDRTMVETLSLHAGFSIQTSRHFEELAEKRRLDFDLDVAREIQKLLLPKHWPVVPGLQIAGKSNAAQQVGGDYLDTLTIDENTIAFAIADVSGKGIPGALMMSIFRTQVRSRAKYHNSPASLLAEINQDMAGEIKKGMFISAIYGVIDLRTFTIRFARAGHNPPLLFRQRDFSLAEITPAGIALGLGDPTLFGMILEDTEVVLNPGDTMTFYTDGVTEAENSEGQEYGLQAFMDAIRRSARQGARGILEHVAHHLTRFSAGAPQQDDITMLILCRPDESGELPHVRNAPEEGFPDSI